MQQPNEQHATGLPEATILVVDDDATIRGLLRACLARGPHRVVEAENGEEALQRVADHRPALVLTDMMMPRMGGSELARSLRDDPATRAIPIVAISAGPHAEEARAAGCVAFLAKPFRAQQLIEEVRRWLAPPAVVERRDASPKPVARLLAIDAR
ncbi:MAG TPA: response regulator [Chloroflexota bacterium]